MAINQIPAKDLPPLEGEKTDIREWATEVCGREWLRSPNANFGGKTPESIITAGRPDLVRGAIRTIVYIGMS